MTLAPLPLLTLTLPAVLCIVALARTERKGA